MNRKTVGPLALVVSLTLMLTACSSLSSEPAGRLSYPSARLTHTVQSFGDSDNVMKTYSFAPPGPTAAQVFDWYARQLSSLGYAASEPRPTVWGPGSVGQLFEGDGHSVDVTAEVVGKLAPSQAAASPSSDMPASPRTMRSRISAVTVTIE